MITKSTWKPVAPSHPMRREVLESAWDDVHLLVKKTIHQWMHKNAKGHYTYEELEAVANANFIKAYDSYNPNRASSFSTWVRWVVWTELAEHHRRESRYAARVSHVDQLPEDAKIEDKTFDASEFIDCLSEDAQLVAKLALYTPPGLRRCIKKRAGTSSQNVRSVFREYLLGLEWTTARVTAAFQEIRRALGS